jgi:xanthine dehydrogenase accessory factor
MKRELAERILEAKAARQPVALVTRLATGEQQLVRPDETAEPADLAAALADAFRLDRSGVIATGAGEVFVQVFNPPLRMLIVGAVHAAQFLLPIARMAGHDVIVIDPRTAFASEERFAGANIVADWPQDALPKIGIDRRTAVIALTHDAKIDDPALTLALASDAYYIGALGSTRTHAKRAERLKAAGLPDTGIARIHAPIGLDIGAQGPAEIALSIMAQVIAALRCKLTDRADG